MGLLGVVFFFTWHQQSQMTEKLLHDAKETSFPGMEEGTKEEGVEEVEDIVDEPEDKGEESP